MIRLFHGQRRKGFTLVELMIVIAIIGILAAIAIPQFQVYRLKSFDTAAKTDIKNAYTVAGLFFQENPSSFVTLDDLKVYGFNQTASVTVTATGMQNTLVITAKHTGSTKTFSADADGNITE